MIEMKLLQIQIDETRLEQVVVLKEKSGTKILPIVIGINEARAIYDNIYDVQYQRPMTHDLIKSMIEKFKIKLEKLIIDKIENGTFHAKLVFKNKEDVEVVIDTRPSDGLAIALRMKSPIFAEEYVLQNSLEV
ncbi:hypothetical protein B9J78_01515 [bacterium Unc6]|nr:hypothetical protein [bacterium Unc6]